MRGCGGVWLKTVNWFSVRSMTTPNAIKALLRRQLRVRRMGIDGRGERSAVICRRVAELPLFQQARVLHCYLPMLGEVETFALIRAALVAGKRVVVPVVVADRPELAHSWLESLEPEQLSKGVFDTLQPKQLVPAPLGVWEVVVVPLLGFDHTGLRLGYGGGYYDRLLAQVPRPTIGVAFADQEVPALPCEPHDQRLDWIVTERGEAVTQ